MSSPLRRRAALVAGHLAGEATRRLGRGGGTALPGLVAGSLAPDLVENLASLPGHGLVTVTGTNGKTTTTHLLAEIARAAGMRPLTNRSGSNLERGLVTAYVDAAGADGAVSGAEDALGVLEVDEAVLPTVFVRLKPRAAVFLNLFRDQLDRYGEIDSVADGWARAIESAQPPPTLVLNADDPSVALLAERATGRVITFGIDDTTVALKAAEQASDARFCICGHRFTHDHIFVSHVGHWRCTACGRSRPTPDVAATRVHLDADGSDIEVRAGDEIATLRVPTAGLYSVTNVVAAIAAGLALDVPLATSVAAVSAAGPAFGRQERFAIEGRQVRVWLAKNPAGLNEIARALTAADRDLYLLAILNDGIQDGKDVSWIYDADIEHLAGRIAALTCSGARAEELALRFAIAGVQGVGGVEATTVTPHLHAALNDAIWRVPEGGTLDVVATYTAMIEVRGMLAERAGVAAYWEQAR